MYIYADIYISALGVHLRACGPGMSWGMSQWLQRGLAKPAPKHKTNFLQERQMVPVAELVLKELLREKSAGRSATFN